MGGDRYMSSVTVIAEMSVNHNGNLSMALKLCDAAKAAGADIVKTQTYIPHLCIRKGKDYDLLASLALSLTDTYKMAMHCEDIGIEFCSTPDDLESLKFLVEECGVKRIKIGSGSLLYEPLVDAAFDSGLPVLLSTGMATMAQVCRVVANQLRRESRGLSAASPQPITIMHCVSLYPCPPHLANVKAIKSLGDATGLPVGYSDHTIGNIAAMSAIALGATVVEKHFTLDERDDGPDHHMSADPVAFDIFVQMIRDVEVILGHGRKEPSEVELAMIPRIRKDAEGFQPGL
jgi:N,N'-diacetyllegionaminate synthase